MIKANLVILCFLNIIIDKVTSNIIVSVRTAVTVNENTNAIIDKINHKD